MRPDVDTTKPRSYSGMPFWRRWGLRRRRLHEAEWATKNSAAGRLIFQLRQRAKRHQRYALMSLCVAMCSVAGVGVAVLETSGIVTFRQEQVLAPQPDAVFTTAPWHGPGTAVKNLGAPAALSGDLPTVTMADAPFMPHNRGPWLQMVQGLFLLITAWLFASLFKFCTRHADRHHIQADRLEVIALDEKTRQVSWFAKYAVALGVDAEMVEALEHRIPMSPIEHTGSVTPLTRKGAN